MAKYEVGYGKPPKSGRFRPGVSGNSKGRPKRKISTLSERVTALLDAPMEYSNGKGRKIGTRREVALMALVNKAARGGDREIKALLKLMRDLICRPENGAAPILIENWLPDYPDQTAADVAAAAAKCARPKGHGEGEI